jgi:hypothetical protein
MNPKKQRAPARERRKASSPTLKPKSNVDDELVDKIIVKLKDSTPVLNGGWDVMMSQLSTIDGRVEDLKNTIYDPEHGIYTRISAIQGDVRSLVEWRGDTQKQLDTITDEQEHIDDKLANAVRNVDDIVEWKKKLNGIVKWVVLTAGSSGVGALAKIFFEYASKLK